MKQPINQGRLFLASCLSLVVTAMIFALRGNVEDQVVKSSGFFSDATAGANYGWISTMAFFGFAASILVASPMLDNLGMRNLLYLAFALHIVGILGFIAAPSYGMMTFTMLLAGFGNGLVEAVINPLIATLYPNEKTHKLNVLHAWWPGGLIIGGLLGYFMNQAHLSWKVQMGIILIPTLIYGFLIFGQEFPLTERMAAGISTADMFKAASNPLFLLLMGCMMITASIELAPGQMVASVINSLAKQSNFGILILVYGSALMFVLRYFAGTLAHLLSPIGMMFTSVILAAGGLFLLANVSSTGGAFLAATVFYVGVCFMWPTMLGITSERFPEGGALAMGLMGFVGQFALGLVIFKMGSIRDSLKISAGWTETADQATKSAAEAAADGAAFRYVAMLAVIPAIVFGLWWMKDRAAGGYKAVKLSES